MTHHHIDPECSAYERGQVGGHHHCFGQAWRKPRQEHEQQQHDERQAFGAYIVQEIVWRVPKHADADECQAGHHQQEGQNGDAQHEMWDFVAAIRISAGAVVPEAL